MRWHRRHGRPRRQDPPDGPRRHHRDHAADHAARPPGRRGHAHGVGSALGSVHDLSHQVRAQREGRSGPGHHRGWTERRAAGRLRTLLPHHRRSVRRPMNKLLKAVVSVGLTAGAISLVSSERTASADAFTTGSLRGTVKDKNTGEPGNGATVVATSPALQGEQVVIADASGGYFITSLPPGVYTLTVYYND